MADGEMFTSVCIPSPITTTVPTPLPTLQTSTMQSTTPNTSLPPFEHIGNNGCPEGFMLEHNGGSLFFDCPNMGGCGTACDQDGNCTTSCSSAQGSCDDAIASGKIFSFKPNEFSITLSGTYKQLQNLERWTSNRCYRYLLKLGLCT